MAETVRIEPEAHAALSEIARAKHLTLTEALTRAVDAYRREMMIAAMDADYAALWAEPNAAAEEEAERRLWDATLRDGATKE